MRVLTDRNVRLFVVFFFICFGAGKAIYLYYLNSSLWYDTAVVALNLLEKNYTELHMALKHYVVAPVLFLYLEKFFLTIFNDPDYGLRFLPLCCFLASIPLIYRVTALLTSDVYAASLSVSLFCVSPLFAWYSYQAKPYIVDVFVLLIIFYLTIRTAKNFERQLIGLAVAGSVSILLSFPSVIVLFSVGAYLFLSNTHNIRALVKVFLTTLVWMTVFVLYYKYSLEPIRAENTDLLTRWSTDRGFFPFSHPEFIVFSTFVVKVMARIIFGITLHHWMWKVIGVLYIGGVIALLYQRKYLILVLLLTPLFIHLLASSLKMYPVAPRLMLYQGPLYIITVSVFISYFGRIFAKYIRLPMLLFLPAFLTLFLNTQFSFPAREFGIKNGLKYIESNFVEGDTIYVYHATAMASKYYRRVGHVEFGKSDANFIYGIEPLDHDGEFPQQLLSVGGRLWFVF